MATRPSAQILDLDGSLTAQPQLVRQCAAGVVPLREWGPKIRLLCAHARFNKFAQALNDSLAGDDRSSTVRLIGSGDFHHVSLALIRRCTEPCNVLVLDAHPDWMRAVPLLHCGTWLYHAARLPHVECVFHVGGETDFDNHYRPLAPWPMLRSGKICVTPWRRCFTGGGWRAIEHSPLRESSETPASPERIDAVFTPLAKELAARPLYISIDKDVLSADEAVANWDSGGLTLSEVTQVIDACLRHAGGRLAGADIVGDWSPVRVSGWLRRASARIEHPRLTIDPARATAINERANLALLKCIETAIVG